MSVDRSPTLTATVEAYAAELAPAVGDVVRRAASAVPAFAERVRAAGLSLDQLASGDVTGLPVLTKDDIRGNYEDFIAPAWRGRTINKTTGGSTGQPFRFEYTCESYERRMAVTMRGYSWAGARPGRRTRYMA